MNDERDWIKSLDRPAAGPPPRVDVVHSVLADLRRTPPAEPADPFLRLLTIATGLAAVVIASIATTQLYSAASDPVRALTAPWAMVMQ